MREAKKTKSYQKTHTDVQRKKTIIFAAFFEGCS